ncbi:hypothetical protein INT48_002839 [Thamnidium elegans]|uniref:F-box domain-containing protein n=1 Tax=Thamnidium elegans TaxID=101142 RepID=A0A8H7SJA2_9FUNG|nr:hypothetical protein INT48_002839 [Thamnidium elegans]
MKFIGVPSRSLLECQLTCKKWSSLAQSRFYKCVILKKSRQLNLLIDLDAHTKGLVHHIMFDYTTRDVNTFTIITSLRKIALYFTEINSIYTNFSFQDEVWQAVKIQRSEGRFAKLHVIPFKPAAKYDDIVQYNDMAWNLQDTLRELEVYDANPVPAQNTERLSHFTNVDTVYFKLRDFNNVYTVDQQIKKARSVRSVDVVCVGFTNDTYHTPVTLNRNAQVLSYIKQLDVRRFLYDRNIYSYVMQVFPNLNKISLTPRKIPEARDVQPLSTDVAIQFTKYLLRISLLYVTYIPFEDLEQVLMEFYDNKRIIKDLDIQYTHDSEKIRYSSYLSIWTYIKDKINIEVNYGKESPRFILPRIGMIEQNGDDFQHIKMDMGFDVDVDVLEILANQGDQDDDLLSNFLSKCPNLKTIYIARTLLRTFGTGLEEKKIPFLQEMELNTLLVYDSFLFDMSSHLNFIDKFAINTCRLSDETKDNVSINMPDTKFTSITYSDSIHINSLYLKLSTVEDNTTRWFVGNRGDYDTCTENEYQNSLRDKDILSLFIQCKQVDCVSFSIYGFNLVIKTNSK